MREFGYLARVERAVAKDGAISSLADRVGRMLLPNAVASASMSVQGCALGSCTCTYPGGHTGEPRYRWLICSWGNVCTNVFCLYP